MKKVISDEEFWKWATSLKPCRYCNTKFVGPTCPNCESLTGRRK
jgi:hypothetical protein